MDRRMNLPFLQSRSGAFSFLSGKKRDSSGLIVERPGAEEGAWERWVIRNGEASLISTETLSLDACERMVILPTRYLHAWPLWISAEGDSGELVRLELSGRHLLRRGMESSLAILPIGVDKERRLVLAVCPEEPFAEDGMPAGWEEAGTLSFQAAFWSGKTDLVIWREWDSLHLAFYRNGSPVWFCDASAESLPQLAFRCALRLREEGVIAGLPVKILMAGLGEGSSRRISDSLLSVFPGSSVIARHPELPPPQAPSAQSHKPLDLPPGTAREKRARRAQKERLLHLAAVAAGIYALLLAWASGDLLMRRTELGKLRAECSSLESSANQARASSERWKALRGAVDPTVFALDLLSVVAAPTEGGKIRLTRFSIERGRLQISAEATDVTQAYAFMERIKKSEELSAYDWTSGQPQLAGKNSVRFDMEGTNRDEKPGS